MVRGGVSWRVGRNWAASKFAVTNWPGSRAGGRNEGYGGGGRRPVALSSSH
jgi:hypothetical protein